MRSRLKSIPTPYRAWATFVAAAGLILGSGQATRADILVGSANHISPGNTGKVLRYDHSGNFLGQVVTGLNFVQQLDFGPDGKLYVPVSTEGKIYRYLANGTPDGVFCEVQSPGSIAFDAAGIAYVAGAAGTGTAGILKYDSAGNLIASLPLTHGAGWTYVGPDGYLYISTYSSVWRMKTDGTDASKLFDAAQVVGLAFAANGDLYATLENAGLYRWTGTSLVPFVTNFGSRLSGLRIDQGGIFWVGAANNTGQFFRVQPNGTVTSLNTGYPDSPQWFAVTPFAPADTTPPVLASLGVGLTGASNGLPYLRVQATDGGSGVLKVQLTANSTNCHLEYPLGTRVVPEGTPRPHTLILPSALGSVTVYAVKDTNASARVEARAWDAANNTVLADPVIANLEIKKGHQLTRTFTRIPAEEHYITVQNGSPGIIGATLWVNGKVVSRGSLGDGQTITLNVAEQMRSGKRNTVRITARGEKGAKAVLLIGDASLAGGSATTAGVTTAKLNTEFSR